MLSSADGHEKLTVLSPQQTVEHLLHHDGVEFDELGESLDDFALDKEKRNVNRKTFPSTSFYLTGQNGFYLLEAIYDWN